MTNPNGAMVPATGSALVSKTGFGSSELAQRNETASTAVAARETALTQAKFVMALQRPRIFDDVRTELLRECERPSFAKAARYRRPQGKKKNEDTGQWEENFVEGWSIRFVETAVRIMGNVEPQTSTIYDDESKRIIRCSVCDFEKNAHWSSEITVEKTIERRELRRNQVPLAKRKNSYGEDVYILPATDEEVRMKEARLVSITLRTLGLRLIPGDLLEDALERARKTQLKEIQQDPNAARKEMVEKFSRIGVKAADLVEYLGGRQLDEITPDQILELRAIGATLMEEGVTWKDILGSSPYLTQSSTDVEDQDSGQVNERAASARSKVQAKVDAARQRRASAGKPPATSPGQATSDEEQARRIDRGDDERQPGED